jgi:anti-sigma regulatory factor (Ser/Thr protein kinase)
MSQQQSNVRGTEELIPTKQALTSLKSDVTHETAIEELIDNAIDNALREHSLARALTISVYAERHEDEDGDRTELVVRDDAGGVRRENANIVFTLGDSGETADEPLIGAYGLGAKKALMNLGLPFTIASRHEDAEVGWSYTIDEEWLSNDTNWEVEVTLEEDLDPGVTEIRVHDLDYDWFGDEDDEDDEDEVPTPERLRKAFGHTYNLFLGDFGGNDYDVTIEVQGEPVDPLGSPDYSFTPVDDMYPRRFENITIDLDGYATTDVAITVGQLREGDNEAAGIDVYMQGRQVLYAERDERVGFGSELDTFDPRHDTRFKMVVELETTDDGQDLPWDTQKNNVDPYNPIMERVNDWVGRIAADYLFLDDGKVKVGFVSPFSPSIPEAANSGKVAIHDFGDQVRVTSPYRPGTAREDVNTINRLVNAHAVMHFRCERAVDDDDLLPAYRQRLDDIIDGAYPNLPELDTDPVEFTEDDAVDIAENIEELVRRHVDEHIEYTEDLPFWQIPKYEAALDDELSRRRITRDDLDEPEDPPEDVPTTIDDLDDGDDVADEELDTGPDSMSEPDEEGEEDDELVEVALRLISGEAGREAILTEGPRSEMAATLDLDDDASDDEIAAELGRRLEVALEF